MPLNHPTQTTLEQTFFKKCNKCDQTTFILDQICYQCRNEKMVSLSGNTVIDDFIRHTLINPFKKEWIMEFVPYGRFKDAKFIAEGGFSKIYKATWIDGPINNWNDDKQKYDRHGEITVALKELNDSKNLNFKHLNELKIYYNFTSSWKNYYSRSYISKYYGITQDPSTKNYMIITKYYERGDLTHFITDNFFNINWKDKIVILYDIIYALVDIHNVNIIHKDYHSGNIFIKDYCTAVTGDLGLSKSAIESLDDEDSEIYGVIPYMAPEIFKGQKYTKASDVYSFGMIMWELMSGRKPFWDRDHDTELILEICNGLRPPIVTNAPEGYIELMQKCYHRDPNKRPTANDIFNIFKAFGRMRQNELDNPTKIIESPDIGPITNNPNAIYKSRPLSAMIKSAESTKSLKIQSSIFHGKNNKRKFNNRIREDNNDKNIKRVKPNKNNDYLTKEFEFDIENDNKQ